MEARLDELEAGEFAAGLAKFQLEGFGAFGIAEKLASVIFK